MKRALILGLAAAVCGLPIAAAAKDPAYKAPQTSFGQPDIGGAWTNATLTPQSRSPLFGTRKVLTPDEIGVLEGSNTEKMVKGNAKSDVSAAATSSDNVGAYDRAWVDNGIGVMRVRGEARTSLITTEDGQVPPRIGQPKRVLPDGAGSPEAGLKAAKQQASVDMFAGQGSVAAARAGSYDNPESRGVGERCIVGFGRNGGPPMFPNGWYNNNYQIVQSPTQVAIDIEMVHDVRLIALDRKTHIPSNIRPWFGDSIGHWEGQTLVVETTNIPKTQAYFGSWENLKITERFTRVANDAINYKFTVEDPTTWEKPWGGEYEMHPLKGDLHEYACHEGNYALEGILAGAREEERKAQAGGGTVAAK